MCGHFPGAGRGSGGDYRCSQIFELLLLVGFELKILCGIYRFRIIVETGGEECGAYRDEGEAFNCISSADNHWHASKLRNFLARRLCQWAAVQMRRRGGVYRDGFV